MTNKYRIISDEYAGYEVQIKYWWLPLFWFQLSDYAPMLNTHASIESAKELIKRHKGHKMSFTKIVYHQE